MKILIALLILPLLHAQAFAKSCLDEAALLELDQRYETALHHKDLAFLKNVLADDFYWVHNHASVKENRAQLLLRLENSDEQIKTRKSHNLISRRLGNTAVIEGLSSVEIWNDDRKTFRTSRYQVMRTYVALNGECKLLAVQSMKVWSSGE